MAVFQKNKKEKSENYNNYGLWRNFGIILQNFGALWKTGREDSGDFEEIVKTFRNNFGDFFLEGGGVKVR